MSDPDERDAIVTIRPDPSGGTSYSDADGEEDELQDFAPDWTCPPGDTISDLLLRRAMSVQEFGQHMELEDHAVRDLLNGRAPVTPELAQKLEKLFSAPARFWTNRELNYRADLVRLGYVDLADGLAEKGKSDPPTNK